MIDEKETKNEGEEVIDTPIELTEENIAKVKEAIADEVRQEAGISDEQSQEFKEMLAEATMPVEFLDKDFKLGDNELDIRKLSKKNLEQMFFRNNVLNTVELRNIRKILLDIMRLLLVLLDHQGVENIVKSTDDVVAKMSEQNDLVKDLNNLEKKN